MDIDSLCPVVIVNVYSATRPLSNAIHPLLFLEIRTPSGAILGEDSHLVGQVYFREYVP